MSMSSSSHKPKGTYLKKVFKKKRKRENEDEERMKGGVGRKTERGAEV